LGGKPIKWKFVKENEVTVKGKDLKYLIYKPSGILIYHDNKLVFVANDDPIKLVLPNLPNKTKEKFVFISDEFNAINELDDNEEYLLVFNGNALVVKDKKHNKVKSLLGITA